MLFKKQLDVFFFSFEDQSPLSPVNHKFKHNEYRLKRRTKKHRIRTSKVKTHFDSTYAQLFTFE